MTNLLLVAKNVHIELVDGCYNQDIEREGLEPKMGYRDNNRLNAFPQFESVLENGTFNT